MFNRLKQALQSVVDKQSADVLNDTEKVSANSQTASLNKPIEHSAPTTYAKVADKIVKAHLPSIDTEPFERVYKVSPVYEPITDFSLDDVHTIIDTLDDPDPRQQVHAIQMAHEVMKRIPSQIQDIALALIDVLENDPDAPARAAAAHALNVVKQPKSGALQDEKDLADMVTEVLAKAVLEDDDLLTRQNAAESLALMGIHRQTFDTLWQNTGGEFDPFITVVAFIQIGRAYLPRIRQNMRKRFEDATLQAYVDYPEQEGLIRSAIQQSKLGRGVPYLVKRYMDNDNQSIRKTIVTTLGHMEIPESLPPLLAFMEDDDPKVSEEAIKAIGNLKNPDAITPLKTFQATLHDSDIRRAIIQKTLIECGDKVEISPMIETLQFRGIPQNRQHINEVKNAIIGLGRDGSQEAIDALVQYLLNTESKPLCNEAYLALVNHPTSAVADAVIERVVDGTLGYRLVKSNFMTTMKVSGAIKLLDEAVETRASDEVMEQVKKDRDTLNLF